MKRKITVEFLDDNSEIEVACYGADSDWVCRLTDPLTQPKGSVSDAFVPFPDLGFLWFREVDRVWVVDPLYPDGMDYADFRDRALATFRTAQLEQPDTLRMEIHGNQYQLVTGWEGGRIKLLNSIELMS